MSALAEELAGDQGMAFGFRCHICSWIREQPLPAQGEWHEEFSKPTTVVSHMSLLRALARRNLTTSEAAVKRHRRNHA